MILHRILLRAVKRQTHELIVNLIEVKHEELAGSRDGWVNQAGTVGACRAPREKCGSSSSARRARVVPGQGLELPFHARETICVVAKVSGLCKGRGF
jgi:hypothetical protein